MKTMHMFEIDVIITPTLQCDKHRMKTHFPPWDTSNKSQSKRRRNTIQASSAAQASQNENIFFPFPFFIFFHFYALQNSSYLSTLVPHHSAWKEEKKKSENIKKRTVKLIYWRKRVGGNEGGRLVNKKR